MAKSNKKNRKNNINKSQQGRPKVNADLLAKRYFQDGDKSWEDVVNRVARHAGKKSGNVKEFYDAIYSGKFFPSRMAYMGTSSPFASSCFVFPIEDNLHSIMKTLSDACKVQKFGGGTGYNFSHLRPKGDLINTSKGEASGPVSFMKLYHNAMEVVNRAGKKHAAQMGILNCDHPNIMEFIQCKDKEGAYWTFNISIAVTDKFLEAVKNDKDWDLQFNRKVYKTIKAKELWDYIVQHAWHNGDPGVIFIDTVNRKNKYPEPIEACNPCGEQMLPPYVSCNLGSIDLSKFVVNEEVDWDGLAATTQTGIRFLDGSVDAAFWPVKKIQQRTRKFKNIGLGVMGWADMLILLGIQYDSDKAIKLGEKIMKFINKNAIDESKKLGKGKRKNTTLTSIAPTGSISLLAGCSSGIEPLFGVTTMKNTYVGSYTNVHWIFEKIAKDRGFYSEDLIGKIAEKGTVQEIEGVPEDIKKLFRTAMEVGWEWHVKHQAAFQKYTDNAVSKTINLPNDASIEDVNEAYMKAYETGCKSITVYRDGSRQVQVMDNKKKSRQMCPNCEAILFMNDGDLMCVTCGYKPSEDESREDEEHALLGNGISHGDIDEPKRERPMIVNGSTYKLLTPVGKAYIIINEDAGGMPIEVFVNVGKAGSDLAAMAEALGRVISTSLRFRGTMDPKERAYEIADQLAGIGGRRSVGFGPTKILSLPDAVAAAFSMHYKFNVNGFGKVLVDNNEIVAVEENHSNGNGTIKNMVKETREDLDQAVNVLNKINDNPDGQTHMFAQAAPTNIAADICPNCGANALVYQEGCVKCHSCGHSEC